MVNMDTFKTITAKSNHAVLFSFQYLIYVDLVSHLQQGTVHSLITYSCTCEFTCVEWPHTSDE